MAKNVNFVKNILCIGFSVMLILYAGYINAVSAFDNIDRWELNRSNKFDFSYGNMIIRSEDWFFTSINASIEIFREVDHIYPVVFEIYPVAESRSINYYGTPCLTISLDNDTHYIRVNFTVEPTEYVIRGVCTTIPGGVTMNVVINAFSLFSKEVISNSTYYQTYNTTYQNTTYIENTTYNTYNTIPPLGIAMGIGGLLCLVILNFIRLKRS